MPISSGLSSLCAYSKQDTYLYSPKNHYYETQCHRLCKPNEKCTMIDRKNNLYRAYYDNSNSNENCKALNQLPKDLIDIIWDILEQFEIY